MKRYIERADRGRWTFLPECIDDWIGEDNPVRAIDGFVDALDLAELCFKVQPAGLRLLHFERGMPPRYRPPTGLTRHEMQSAAELHNASSLPAVPKPQGPLITSQGRPPRQ
jgi:hypothetical protein